MISTFKTVNAVEQLTTLHSACANSLAQSIDAAAHYAVEMNPHDAALFRQHLTQIAKDAATAATVEDYEAVRSSFRGELRDYRDRSHSEITRLRTEIQSAATAMQSFAETVTTGTDEHEMQIREEFGQLEEAARCDDPVVVREAIGQAIQAVSQSCAEMKRGNQAVVAQLQDELRALHQQIENERRALYTDRSSGVWNRHKIDGRIADLARRQEAFCVLLVGIPNLRDMYVQHSRTVIEGSIRALVGRMQNLLGEDAMIGRWSEAAFAIILDLDPVVAERRRAQAERKLSGNYSIQENGISRNVELDVRVGLVERAKGSEGADFFSKLSHSAAAVSELS